MVNDTLFQMSPTRAAGGPYLASRRHFTITPGAGSRSYQFLVENGSDAPFEE